MNETQELEKQSESLVVRAQGCQAIASLEQYTDVVELGRALRAMLAGIEEFWKPLIASAHKQHKDLLSRQKNMTDPVNAALVRIKLVITSYEAEEERKRQEAERIAAEAMRKQQEAEAMREAESLVAAGDRLGAEALIEQAINAPPPPVVIQSSIPTIAGKSSRQNWTFRITDPALIPREYLIPDGKAIGQVVRALKDKTKIPGVQPYPESVIAFRS